MGLFSSKKNKSASKPEAGNTTAPRTPNDEPPAESQAIATPPNAMAATSPGTETKEGTLSEEAAQKQVAVSKQLAAAFGEVVTLLLRSETDRIRQIADLEWMVAPAIATGQFAIAQAQAKTNGAVTPVGAVLWAMVSEDTDRRLSDTQNTQISITPQDWRSGSIPWIMLAIGDKGIVAGLLRKLSTDVFKGTEPKMRSRTPDGKVVVGRVNSKDTEKPTS